ncbi:hypothetical protein Scep_006018 [Stephania cephalantha]|uniref:1-phosphatidylinositol 4-kinase n=1 Tax=Stephania cephalantha TaxID=152367 RepID=A0AAP0K7C3_9MAGN
MSASGVTLNLCNEPAIAPGFFCGPGGALPDKPILIYVTVAGSMIPMQVLESDSIASVKLKIQTCKGFVVRKQKLVFEGRELARSESLIRDYGVGDGKVLHLVVRLSDLQFITVRTACGKEIEFHIDRSRNFGYVKQTIANKGKGFINVKDQELMFNGEKLDDRQIIDDICNINDGVIHLVVQKSAKVRAKPTNKTFELSIVAPTTKGRREKEAKDEEVRSEAEYDDLQVATRKLSKTEFWLEPMIINSRIKLPRVIRDMVNTSCVGLKSANQPIRTSDGCGGAYFMQDPLGLKYVSVFKPIDEEPLAINNPQRLPLSSDGEGLKRGTRVGEGALREVAAYILDHPRTGRRSLYREEIGFSGVPPTVMVRCLHKAFNHPEGFEHAEKNIKIGSLQMFMKNCGSCEDMGPQSFPVEEVHKISVLDIRLANADRHAGNILMSKEVEGQTKLIPIDHGYCLPESFEDCTFDWLYWPQARQPYNLDAIEYIRSLDAEEDIALLKFHGWDMPLASARILRISTMLLKKGVERGLTPFAIGSMMCRETLKKESIIEEIICEAKDSMLPGESESVFLESVSRIMDCRLDKLTIQG